MFALDILNQYQSENGNVLAAGKLFIYKQGRTELAEIYSDINGSVELANPVILNNLGMTDTPVYLSRLYSYTVVCKNMYGEELFSRDIYPNIDSDAGPAISGYLYEGISPIVVNNVDKAISAINVPIGVQEPLYFVEDSSAACIIGIDSNVMLSGYITSGDLATVSGEITAMIPSTAGLASEEYVNSSVSGKLDTTAFSTVSGSFLTAHQDLSNYATKDFVNGSIDSATSGLLPTSAYSDTSGNFILKSNSADIINEASALSTGWVSDQNYLVANDITGKQDITGMTAYQLAGDYYSASNPSAFVTSGQLSTVSADITAMIPTALTGDYLDKASADTLYYSINNPSGFATTSELNTVSGNITALIPTDYYPASNPSGFITGVDLTPYQTTADMTAYVQNSALDDKLDASAFSTVSSTFLTAVPAGYATENWVTSQGYLTAETDWTNTIQEASANAYNEATAAIPTGLATTSDLQTVSGEITALIPSTAGLATTGDVNDLAISISETYQVKGDYLTTGDSANFYTTANESGFITNDAITGKQDITGMTAYQEAGNYYSASNPSGFITNDAITGKQDVTGMTAYQPVGDYYSASNPSGFITAVPTSYLQNTDLGITNNIITSISGLTIAGVEGDYELVPGNGIQLVDDPNERTTTISVSGDYATNSQLQTVSGEITALIPTALTGDYLDKASADTLYYGINNPSAFVTSGELNTVSGNITAMIPTALTGDYLDKASADTLYYPLNTNPSGYLVEDDITGKQDITGMTAYQPVGNYYSASNPSGFITNDAITGKQDITGMTAYAQNSALDNKVDYSSFTYSDNLISAINGSALLASNESEEVSLYELVAGSGISIIETGTSAIINVTAESGDPEVNLLVQTNSATWDSVTGKQDELTFEYDTVNAISSINNSAISTTPSRELYIQAPLFTGMSGTSAYLGCSAEFPASAAEACALVQTNSATWDSVTGYATKSDVNYLSGQIGNVEALLASL